jgi:hypothetical protein
MPAVHARAAHLHPNTLITNVAASYKAYSRCKDEELYSLYMLHLPGMEEFYREEWLSRDCWRGIEPCHCHLCAIHNTHTDWKACVECDCAQSVSICSCIEGHSHVLIKYTRTHGRSKGTAAVRDRMRGSDL